MQQLQQQQPHALRAGAELWANGAARGGRRLTAVRKKPHRHTCKPRDEGACLRCVRWGFLRALEGGCPRAQRSEVTAQRPRAARAVALP